MFIINELKLCPRPSKYAFILIFQIKIKIHLDDTQKCATFAEKLETDIGSIGTSQGTN